jgi:hypothetical protein
MRFQFDPRTDDPRPLATRHEELAARMYGQSVTEYRAQKAAAEAALFVPVTPHEKAPS